MTIECKVCKGIIHVQDDEYTVSDPYPNYCPFCKEDLITASDNKEGQLKNGD